MALQSWPITRTRFLAYAIARANDNPFKDVDNGVIDEWCGFASDVIASAMGYRVVKPLLQIDQALEGHGMMLVWREVMGARGYRRDQGRDSEISDRAKAAEAFFERVRTKAENPTFVDSSSVGIGTRDAISITTNPTAEFWKYNGYCRGRC